MHSPDHCARAMSNPRISFSTDFVVEPPQVARNPRPPPDPNFEFSVGSHHMIAADQLFFKGRLLPLRDSDQCFGGGAPHGTGRLTTLRDELRTNDDDRRPPSTKGSIKWKELLGLKNKSQSTSKRGRDKCNLDQVNESQSVVKSA